MSTISSSTLPVAARQLTSKPSGSYEINAREYGPLAAGAIGLTQAAWQGGENAVSSVVSLSEAGLQKLSEGASAVADGVAEAAETVVDGVEDAAQAVSDGLSDAADAVVDGVSDAAQAVADGAEALVDQGAELLQDGWDALGDLGESVTGYLTAGVVAGKALLDELT
jgi:X-X-X-Leu-X-X-Gly heptad repeat protein